MKIAIDCHTLEIDNWAGKEQLTASLVRELAKIDNRNEYYLYLKKPVSALLNLPSNFKIVRIGWSTPFWQIGVMFSMIKTGIDFLYVPCSYLLPALNFFKPQAVNVCDLTTFLSGVSDSHKFSTKIRERLLLGMALRNSSAVTVISESTKKDIKKFFKIKEEKISVIYPGAKKDFKIIKDPVFLQNISDKYSLPKKFLLSVGTLEPRKNGINLIDGFEGYVEKTGDNDMFLVFVGKKGWFYESLLDRVRLSKIKDRILFLGYVPDEELVAFYNLAFCLVYPSFYEGFGLPIVEAMACACPVISSNTSSMPEISGEGALLVDPCKAEQITMALFRLKNEEHLRDFLIEKSLLRANIFTYSKMAEEWLKFVEKQNK